ncbi:MAG: DUF2796 domain-containing protein [Steroidobacteraceae bacterium]|jgi:hypothetical protein|nr:DUF2796 domain-containing protein [Steroidobacteraceae bacterium]
MRQNAPPTRRPAHAPGWLAGCVLAALAGPALATEEFTQHAAHEHGKATLDVALDGGTLTVALATPAINVLGFERPPRTDAEKKAVADATALLRAHARLFAFPVAARCTAGSSSVTAPEWSSGGHAHGKDTKHDHAHGDGKRHAHDHAHDHEHHHADYAARWTFTCAQPAALGFFEAPLVDRLQPGTTVQANVVTGALQTRQDLKTGAIRVRLR